MDLTILNLDVENVLTLSLIKLESNFQISMTAYHENWEPEPFRTTFFVKLFRFLQLRNIWSHVTKDFELINFPESLQHKEYTLYQKSCWIIGQISLWSEIWESPRKTTDPFN